MAQPVQYNSTSERRQVPLIVGAVYQLIPSMGGQYVIVRGVDRKYVYISGYDNNYADIKVRIRRFPEIVIKVIGYTSSGSALTLVGEVGYVIMLSGDRIGLFEQGET